MIYSSTTFARTALRHAAILPGVAYCVWKNQNQEQSNLITSCDDATAPIKPAVAEDLFTETDKDASVRGKPTQEKLYHGLFPVRQLWTPKKEYPLWDANWDSRQPTPLKDPREERARQRQLRKDGVTRHVILIRHGQYDERSPKDVERVLTPLGEEQAHLTGQRLRELLQRHYKDSTKDCDDDAPPPNIVVKMHVSDMTRAKQTADLIASHLDFDQDNITVQRTDPNPQLNEGRPAHNIPGSKASPSTIEKMDDGSKRIEKAFQGFFHRYTAPSNDDEGKEEEEGSKEASDDKAKPTLHHEYEIVVCHANVIRYFFCRALQLPPEAWLRLCNFNCSLTYFTIRSTGSVTCRSFGDTGHIPLDKNTFSMHHGYNW